MTPFAFKASHLLAAVDAPLVPSPAHEFTKSVSELMPLAFLSLLGLLAVYFIARLFKR